MDQKDRGRTPLDAHRAGFGFRRDDVDGVLDGITTWSVTTSWRPGGADGRWHSSAPYT